MGLIFHAECITPIIAIILCYAACSRIWIWAYEKFFRSYPEDESHLRKNMVRLIQTQNNQIDDVISEQDKDKFRLAFIKMLKNYNNNIAVVIESLNQFLLSHLKEYNIREEDIYISFLDLVKRNGSRYLNVVSFIDGKDYELGTSEISFDDAISRGYASAIVFNTGKMFLLHKANSRNFAIENQPRRETIKQYMGIPICVGRKVTGVLHIELHRSIFSSRRSLKKFVEKYIFPFRLFLQYYSQRDVVGKRLEGG